MLKEQTERDLGVRDFVHLNTVELGVRAKGKLGLACNHLQVSACILS